MPSLAYCCPGEIESGAMNVHAIYKLFFAHFRSSRMRKFESLFPLNDDVRILDLGGSHLNWGFIHSCPRVTILNLHLDPIAQAQRFTYIHGDGCATQLPDSSFDVVFSNSVIEHVGGPEKQQAFADECRRCGKSYFVQTPNRWFLFDLHTWLPLAHWLPDRWFKKLIPFSPRILLTDDKQLDLADCMGLRLLGVKEMRRLFPDAMIIKERFMGITKSIIAFRINSNGSHTRSS
jgi:hypothetical protein